MKIERLFQVLVVTGASSTVGLIGCGSDNSGGGGGGGAAGAATGGGTSASGGASSPSAGGGSSASCAAACKPDPGLPSSWIDCNGCCCWLAAGQMVTSGTQICGVEPCCAGKGPGR